MYIGLSSLWLSLGQIYIVRTIRQPIAATVAEIVAATGCNKDDRTMCIRLPRTYIHFNPFTANPLEALNTLAY